MTMTLEAPTVTESGGDSSPVIDQRPPAAPNDAETSGARQNLNTVSDQGADSDAGELSGAPAKVDREEIDDSGKQESVKWEDKGTPRDPLHTVGKFADGGADKYSERAADIGARLAEDKERAAQSAGAQAVGRVADVVRDPGGHDAREVEAIQAARVSGPMAGMSDRQVGARIARAEQLNDDAAHGLHPVKAVQSSATLGNTDAGAIHDAVHGAGSARTLAAGIPRVDIGRVSTAREAVASADAGTAAQADEATHTTDGAGATAAARALPAPEMGGLGPVGGRPEAELTDGEQASAGRAIAADRTGAEGEQDAALDQPDNRPAALDNGAADGEAATPDSAEQPHDIRNLNGDTDGTDRTAGATILHGLGGASDQAADNEHGAAADNNGHGELPPGGDGHGGDGHEPGEPGDEEPEDEGHGDGSGERNAAEPVDARPQIPEQRNEEERALADARAAEEGDKDLSEEDRARDEAHAASMNALNNLAEHTRIVAPPGSGRTRLQVETNEGENVNGDLADIYHGLRDGSTEMPRVTNWREQITEPDHIKPGQVIEFSSLKDLDEFMERVGGWHRDDARTERAAASGRATRDDRPTVWAEPKQKPSEALSKIHDHKGRPFHGRVTSVEAMALPPAMQGSTGHTSYFAVSGQLKSTGRPAEPERPTWIYGVRAADDDKPRNTIQARSGNIGRVPASMVAWRIQSRSRDYGHRVEYWNRQHAIRSRMRD